MNGRFSFPALFVAAAIMQCSLLGCSIREDRDGCPSVLKLNLAEAWDMAENHGIDEMMLFVDDGTSVSSRLVKCGESEVRIIVPRGNIDIDVYGIEGASAGGFPSGKLRQISAAGGAESVAGGFFGEDGGVYGLDGKPFPPLWRFSGNAVVAGECTAVDVGLHKDYCRMTVAVTDEDDRTWYPYGMTFRSQVNGVFPGGGISSGELIFSLSPGYDRQVSATVPRQSDGSLVLELFSSDGILRTFPIGEYIIASGYDWDAVDLEDIELNVDFSMTRIKVGFTGWDKTYTFLVEI